MFNPFKKRNDIWIPTPTATRQRDHYVNVRPDPTLVAHWLELLELINEDPRRLGWRFSEARYRKVDRIHALAAGLHRRIEGTPSLRVFAAKAQVVTNTIRTSGKNDIESFVAFVPDHPKDGLHTLVLMGFFQPDTNELVMVL